MTLDYLIEKIKYRRLKAKEQKCLELLKKLQVAGKVGVKVLLRGKSIGIPSSANITSKELQDSDICSIFIGFVLPGQVMNEIKLSELKEIEFENVIYVER